MKKNITILGIHDGHNAGAALIRKFENQWFGWVSYWKLVGEERRLIKIT